MIAINKKKRNLQVVSEVTFILQGRWSTGNKDVFVNIKKCSIVISVSSQFFSLDSFIYTEHGHTSIMLPKSPSWKLWDLSPLNVN